jgi:HAE1 family hydrophobic/amphiphilic exporter-1
MDQREERIVMELHQPKSFLGKIADYFIQNFQMSVLVILLIISVGIFGALTLPKESLPEIVFPAVNIQTLYLGAGPEDVEQLVTDPIEKKIKDLEGIDKIVSESNFGFSFVNVTYKEGIDINQKKIELDNALREINFPDGVNDPTTNIFKTSEIPLMEISVAGPYSIFTLTQLASDVADGVEGVRGVEGVEVFGGLKQEIQIILNPVKMLELKISQNDLTNALKGLNVSFPIGEADLNGVRYTLRVDESLTTIDQIKNVLIRSPSGTQVLLKDVAKVVDTSEPLVSFNQTYVQDGSNQTFSSVSLRVTRKASSDVIGASNGIKQLLEKQKGVLYPDDLKLTIVNDQAVNVTRDINNIQSSALSGLIVVVIVLFLFIGIKEAVIVSITIPLSLLGTMGILNFFNITFNTFAILGLIVALGLLVDNSIIVMENIDRLKKMGVTTREAASVGTNQVAFPLLSSTLTTVAAFFPLAILPGILGDFISTIPIVIIITLIVSLFVSILITPAIATRILKDRHHKHHSKKQTLLINVILVALVALASFYSFANNGEALLLGIIGMVFFTGLIILKLTSKKELTEESKSVVNYGILMRKIITSRRNKALVLLVGALIFVGSGSVFVTGLLKVDFFPRSEPNSVNLVVDPPGGVTLDDTARITERVLDLLRSNPNIAIINVTVGGNEIDRATISAELVPKSQLTESGFDVVDKIEKAIRLLPGAQITVTGVAAGPPVGKPIGLKLKGDDIEGARLVAESYAKILNGIDGVYNVEVSAKQGVMEVYLNVRELKAQTYGLTSLSIAQQLRGYISGSVATTIRVDGEEVNVVIKKDPKDLKDLQNIKNLYVTSNTGDMIPLSSVVDFEEIDGISSIRREQLERVIEVTADLKKGFNVNDVMMVFDEQSKDVSMPSGVRLDLGGDVEGIAENFIALFQSLILAVFLVFIILTIQFKSIAQPFAILTTVPMALIGVIWGLIITGNDFGFYAFMGMVALVGIAVNDAIVLIDYMNYLQGEGVNRIEAIVKAGMTRFNPVLATTLTTIAGVLPLGFKDATYAQLAFSLIFGLLVTTIMTLVFIPIVYSIIEAFKDKHMKRAEGETL